jgi:hypothetical protein
MSRFKIPELILGSFLTVAIFSTGALFAWRPEAPKARSDAAEQSAAKKGDYPKAPDSELIGPTWLTKDAAGFFAFISALVVGGQAAMFFIQLRYMRIGMRDATIAAKAARDGAAAATEAARVARNAERPYLTPFTPELRNWTESILESNEFKVMEVHLDIKNIGKGVGFIKGYGIAHEICIDGRQGSVPLTVQEGFSMMPLRADSELDAGAAFDVFQISADDRLAMIEFDRSLYIYGYTRYSDLFGIVRRSGFSFEFIPNKTQPEKSAFVMCTNPLWYDEEEPKTA